MMTPEQLAEELKALHYTEKLVLAQKLIEYAYDELAQLSSQLAPLRSSSIMEEKPEPHAAEQPDEEAGANDDGNAVRQEKPRPSRKGSNAAANVKITSFNELVQTLKKNKCRTEAALVREIIDLYKYRGEISSREARKIIARFVQKNMIDIDGNGMVSWRV